MSDDETKNAGGRPSKYLEEYDALVKEMCEGGATDAEMCAEIGISMATFYRWRNQFPSFREALKLGKAPADDRVELSLYHKAIGTHIIEEQAVKLRDKDGNERVEIVQVRRSVPPDTTAMIFFLKNRRRRQWQDAQVIQHELPLASEVAKAMQKVEEDI